MQAGYRVAIHYEDFGERGARTAEECGAAALFRANLEKVDEIRRMFGEVERALRRALRIGEQRRAIPAARSARDHRGGLGFHPFSQFEGDLLLLPAGGAADAETGRGRIVNISSLGRLRPWAEYAHYCASKAGVIMLTKALAKAFAPGITVNSVAPGVILSSAGRAARAGYDRGDAGEDGGERRKKWPTRCFIFSTRRISSPGQVLAVDGGLSLR